MLRMAMVGLWMSIGSGALAQSINLKFGPEDSPVPDSSYGAAGPAGVWNLVNSAEPSSFRALDGSATTVQNFAASWGTPELTPPIGPSGNDALLLGSSYQFIDVVAHVTITGLQNGEYNAIFYGLNTGARSTMFMTDNDAQFFTGAWTGQLQSGVCYVSLPMTVTNGTMSFGVVGSILGTANWSAMQIVQVPGPGVLGVAAAGVVLVPRRRR